MHKIVLHALPVLSVAIGAIGGPEVGDLIHTFSRQEAAENVLTFYDCKNGEYPVTQRRNGTLQCAGVELKKLGDETTPDLRAMVDWDATEKRVADSYDSAKKDRPSTLPWALGGAAVAAVLTGAVSIVEQRIDRRRAKAA